MDNTNNPTKKSFLPWFVWIVAASFYSYEFFIRISPTVMVNDLMRHFHVNAEAIGALSAYYYYAYAILQIPVGALLDQYGIRRLLFFAAITAACGNFLFSSTHFFFVAEFSRLLMGIGSAFSFVGCLKLAANWFPKRQFSFLVGLTNTLGVVGAICAGAPLAYFFVHYGWHATLIGMGIIGTFLALLIRFSIHDEPNFSGCISTCSKQERQSHTLWEGLKRVIYCKRNWLTALYGGLMVAPVAAFTELWSVPFFTQVHHFSHVAAAGLSSLMFVGIAVGAPIHTFLSSVLQRRRIILFFGNLGALFCLSALIYLDLSLTLTFLLLFLFGFFISSMLLVFAMNVENNPRWANGIVIGFTNTFVMIGGTVFQPLVGRLLDLQWDGRIVNGVQIFSAQNYRIALSLAVFSLLAALVLLTFIQETYCRQSA